MIFEVGKNPPKMTKVRTRGGHGKTPCNFWGGSAAQGGTPGTVRSLTGTGRSLHRKFYTPLPPQGGRRILRLTPHAADPKIKKGKRNIKLQTCQLPKCRKHSYKTSGKSSQKGSTINQTSEEMVPGSAPKGILGQVRLQERYFGGPS